MIVNNSKKQNMQYLIMVLIFSLIFMIFAFVWIVSGQKNSKVDKELDSSNSIENEETSEETFQIEENEIEEVDSMKYQIQEKISEMTLEEKVAQLFIITPEALTDDREVSIASDITKTSLETYPVGGLIYFSKNITTKEELTIMLTNTQTYSKEITGLPIFLSIDEEGGKVARIGNSGTIEVPILPNMSEIGLTGDTKKAYEVGVTIGTYLSELGFNLDYAPVADVLTNPENVVVKERSFGSDPEVVSGMAMEVIKGMKEQGIFGALKHFPGHGATMGDTHEGYAYIHKTLEEMINDEMLPFITGIENNVSFIMIGHISAPNMIGDNTPSSLSKVMITDTLRNKLGYKGIVITDALNMGAINNTYSSDQAAVKAFGAGADLLLMPADFRVAYEGILQAVRDGVISEDRLNASLERILKVKFEIINP